MSTITCSRKALCAVIELYARKREQAAQLRTLAMLGDTEAGKESESKYTEAIEYLQKQLERMTTENEME